MILIYFCQLTSGQDYGTVNINFITSLISVSNSQYQRAVEYINEYKIANLQLTLLLNNFQDALNSSNVKEFLANIQKHLNTNVAQLTEKFSPENVRNFILFHYNSFLSNLSMNNGTQSEITQMHQLYLSKILSFNATGCLARYNAAHFEIYSSTASNFTKTIENEISATVEQLEKLRNEIKTTITDLVKSLETIIANRETARQKFDEFVREDVDFCRNSSLFHFQISSNGIQIGSQVDKWIEEFSKVMKQTQLSIRDGFKQFDSNRVKETLAEVQLATNCLTSV